LRLWQTDFVAIGGERGTERSSPVLGLIVGVIIGIFAQQSRFCLRAARVEFWRGCASRLLVLSGAGSLRALVAGLIVTVAAQASLRGALSLSQEGLQHGGWPAPRAASGPTTFRTTRALYWGVVLLLSTLYVCFYKKQVGGFLSVF